MHADLVKALPHNGLPKVRGYKGGYIGGYIIRGKHPKEVALCTYALQVANTVKALHRKPCSPVLVQGVGGT